MPLLAGSAKSLRSSAGRAGKGLITSNGNKQRMLFEAQAAIRA